MTPDHPEAEGMAEAGKEILPGRGAELIKYIDPNEGETLRRRGGGLGASLPEPGGLKDIF